MLTNNQFKQHNIRMDSINKIYASKRKKIKKIILQEQVCLIKKSTSQINKTTCALNSSQL